MSIEPTRDNRIAEAEKFLNLLYGTVTERKFGYLWTPDKKTYPFDVSNTEARRQMVSKAIELNDTGAAVYLSVNFTDTAPTENERAKTDEVTMQTAIVTDIDIRSDAHKGDQTKLAADFDEAKSFLPFTPSIIINSGYGLQAYYIFDAPIKITDDNREEVVHRNKFLLDVIRLRANGKKIDGVHDLPRVLRVPGTFNYKLGRDNAPLCHIVEESGLRFSPAELDEKLNALAPTQVKDKKKTTEYPLFDNHDFDIWRAQKMLEAIPVALLSRDDWYRIGMALKSNGNSCSDWEQWSRNDERFKEGECEQFWNDAKGTTDEATIASIYYIAEQYGYDAKEISRQWLELHPELSSIRSEKADVMKEISHDFTTQSEPHYESESKDRFTRDFIEDCPINLRLPHFFSFNKRGITQVIPPKKEKDETKYICVSRTPIVPTKKFREPIKGTVEYEFAFLSDGKWRTVEVDGATLGDTRTMKKFLRYHDVLIEDAAKLSSFFNAIIALNSPDMPKIKSYNQTGWTTDDCEEFAYPSANSTAVIRRVGYDYDKIFKPRGDKEAWKKKFLEVTKQGGAQSHIIIGAACAAPLIKPLEDLPNLQIHVWGRKSIGKTPMLKFAVSIFGNTDVDKLTHTFAATPKSRLETACAFNDMPLICEELESIGAKDTEKLSADIYNYFLGIGGQALKRDGTKRTAKLFCGTRLTCGEHSLVQSFGNGGEFKRVLDLRCASLLKEDFASDLYGFCKRNYGLYGEQWIQYIVDNRDFISKTYHQTFDAVRAAQRRTGVENDLTQLRTLVISAVAYQHFKICIGLSKTETNADEINAEIEADIKAITATLPTANEIDDTTRAIEALRSWVAAHDKSFIRDIKHDSGTIEEISSYTPYSYGKIFDTGEVAFFPTELKRILEEDLHFTSAEKLFNEWKDRGNVLITNEDRFTHRITVNKKRARVIHFRPNVISSDSDLDESEYYESLCEEEN